LHWRNTPNTAAHFEGCYFNRQPQGLTGEWRKDEQSAEAALDTNFRK
jgi:hypothetical protein